MCGIAGVVDPAGGAVDPAELERVADRLVHRGPDGRGRVARPGAGLVATRLRIVDPLGGAQPVTNEDGTIHAVFNGELYDHGTLRAALVARGHWVRSRGDTELLVHLYEEHGDALVERLHGIFALAIWDGRRRRLLLARDRFGVKPLFHRWVEGRFRFASELGALLAVGPRPAIDRAALAAYRTFGAVTAPASGWEGVAALPPGHRLTLADGRARVERWAPEPPPPDRAPDAASLRAALDEAIDLQARADVPVGVLLSGGVDSSAIAARLAAKSSAPVRTFTGSFPGAGDLDEGRAAAAFAAAIGAEHVSVPVGPDHARTAACLLARSGRWLGDPSFVALAAVAAAAKRSVRVLLSGTGADELFGGYRRYGTLPAAIALGERPRLRRLLTAIAARVPGGRERRLGAFGLRVKRWLAAASPDAAAAYLAAVRLEPRDDAPFRARFDALGPDPLEAARRIDLERYLPDDLLAKDDGATMAHGVEARVPFLDDAVAEAALRVPARRHATALATKRVLRAALRGRLPARVLARPKRGFAAPIDAWLRGPLRSWAEERLRDPSAAELFAPGEIDEAIAALDARAPDAGHRLWAKVALVSATKGA